MKVDRHNYEEFFILYWDNELSASQRQAVELFVKENTDLQEEFNILGDTRFTPDKNIQLTEKDFLHNDSFINIGNYEERLLDYIDNELSNEQKAEIEKAASRHSIVQKELALLQKTKLYPEPSIIFPDKSVLYRRDEKVRVISMTWFRVAVAAAIILIAGLITFRLATTGNSGDKTEVAKNNPVTSPSVSNNQPANEAVAKAGNDGSNGLTKEKEKPKASPAQKNEQKRDENKVENLLALDDNNKNKIPQERTKALPLIASTDNAVDGASDPEAMVTEKKQFGTPQKNASDIIKTSLEKDGVTLQAKPTLYLPEAEEKGKDGGGLKEFLRKTTRVFERRTKIQTTTEDNKLLVGAFAVSLK